MQTVFYENVRVCHVYCNFSPGYTCRSTVIFGTLNERNLLTNTVVYHQTIVLLQELLPKWRRRFVKNSWLLFCQKAKNFYVVWIIRLCSNFDSLWHKYLLRNYKWHFRLPMSTFPTVTLKTLSLNLELFDKRSFTMLTICDISLAPFWNN